MVVEVGVSGGDDQIMMIVLQFHQLVREQPRVMVINESNGTDDGGVGRLHSGGDKTVADEVAEGFGTVLIALGGDEAVELVEQVGINGNPNAA